MNPVPGIEPSGDQWWVRFSWDREANRMDDMSIEATGLMFKLRAASWVRYGIPIDEEPLARILKHRCGMRLKRFYKLWPEISHCFEEREGFLFFVEDEKERRKVVDISAKRRQASNLGNRARWNRPSEPPSDPIPNGNPFGTADNNNRDQSDRKEQEPLLLPLQDGVVAEVTAIFQLPTEKQGDATGNPNWNPIETDVRSGSDPICDTSIVESEGVTDQEYKQFCDYCADSSSHPDSISFTSPGKNLALRIKKKFKMPLTMIPKFGGQKSVAMWMSDSLTVEQVDQELIRLQNLKDHPERFKKPVGRRETDWDAVIARAGGKK